MAQTPDGALKSAAKNAGLDLAEFMSRRAAGLKRCTCCKEWRLIGTFNFDQSRSDGLSAKGRCCSRVKVRVDRAGIPAPMKGRKFSEAARANMGRPAGFVSEKRGIPRSFEVRANISRAVRVTALRGPACPAYKDGKYAERMNERSTAAYKQWRFDVMLRDRFTCQHCWDDRGGNLHAHHKKPFSTHPELRLDLSNGVTLCEPCHKIVHAAK